jgi:hypothetical protein
VRERRIERRVLKVHGCTVRRQRVPTRRSAYLHGADLAATRRGVSADALVEASMEQLAARRPLFHTEADFQHALAWEIQTSHRAAEIRLEKRMLDEPRVELDILVQLEGRRVGLELKYPRSKLDVEVDGERFLLRTGAPDLDRYDVLRDVARLERLIGAGVIDDGCAIVLTNMAGLWQPAPRSIAASYDAFRVHEGREVSGTVDWGPSAGAGTRTGRQDAITLARRYTFAWRDFSAPAGARLRYLAVPVRAGDGGPPVVAVSA